MVLWLLLLLIGLFTLILGPRATVLVFGPLFLLTVSGGEEMFGSLPEDDIISINADVMIEAVHVNVPPDGPVELHITGHLPDGCAGYPIEVLQGQSGNSITVDIRRWVPENVDCPDILIPYEDVIPLDFALLPGTYALTVNDHFLEFVIPDPDAPVSSDDSSSANPTPTPPLGDRIDSVIENVDATVLESYPMQVVLHVTGYHPDGCEIPVYIEQSRAGNTVTVDVYRVMTSRMPCSDVVQPFERDIKLDGGFESGVYTIRVNEYVLPLEL